MKKAVFLGYLLFSAFRGSSQQTGTMAIQQCYQLAKANYPLVKQMALIEQTREYSIDNAAKGYLPQISINGQVTYQSDVTKIPVSFPGLTIPTLSKDQYKIYGELSQSLTDGYTIRQLKESIKANSVAEEQKLEVELYKLKDRISQLYFGILLIDAQLQQTDLLKKDIRSGITKTNAAMANGSGLRSNADLLEAELLKADQKTVEFKTNRKAYVDMLALFINQPLDEATQLQVPELQMISQGINRPELKLYEVQKKGLDVQNRLILAKNIPHISLFFQGGYGRPALNLLDNKFNLYYIGGARLSWSISGFYTYKRDKQLIGINQSQVDIQKETFVFNTNMQMKQQGSELDKLQQLISTDNQIIALREKVKASADAQLQNGTATTTDYLTYVNAEDQARQSRLLHQVQLLMAQYTYQITSGN